MTYELAVGEFTGPLDKLLELIEEKKLEITEVSLAQVTDDFLRYLEGIRNENVSEARGESATAHLRVLADFIVVASRLIFIKSKSLLPEVDLSEEEEAEIKDLEARLRWYRAFKPAMRHIAALWAKENQEVNRPYFLHAASLLGSQGNIFYPGENADAAALVAALEKIFENLERFAKENQVIENHAVSLEAKADEIIGELKKLNEASLRMLANAASRTEMIVTFLALLHLAREQIVYLTQESHLSDIIVKKRSKKSLLDRQAGEFHPNAAD